MDSLPDLPGLELDLASPACTVISPSSGVYPKAAEGLAAALERLTGRRPRVAEDISDPAMLGPGPLLVLGNLMDSRVARKLYLTAYDFTDLAWPGIGGHVVRTIRDPFGTGAHVIMVGGSDGPGAVVAAREVIEIARAGRNQLGYLNAVKLGRYEKETRAWTAGLLRPDAGDDVWDRHRVWWYMFEIGRAAMGYLRTADEAYLEAFRRELFNLFEQRARQGQPPAAHSLVDALLVPWDLIRDHPYFRIEDRHRIDEALLCTARSAEGPGGEVGREEHLPHVISNHTSGRALDGFFLGRYFQRRYHLPEAQEWLETVEESFAVQLKCGKPLEDNQYHQFQTLHNTLSYALAVGKNDYVSSPAFCSAVNRAIMVFPPGEHCELLLLASVAAEDPGYLSPAGSGRVPMESGRPDDHGYVDMCVESSQSGSFVRSAASMAGATLLGEILRPLCAYAQPVEKRELLGAAVAPVEPAWAESINVRLNPGKLYRITVPAERGFDKLTIREGYGADDFHLVLDGISGCCHSFQDANCIVRFGEAGCEWLSAGSGLEGAEAPTVRWHNGVLVAVGAVGAAKMHWYAHLLEARELNHGDYFAIGGALEGIDPAKWRRHILRKRERWTLVIDAVNVERGGELFLERSWHMRGDVQFANRGVVCRQEDKYLHLQSAGVTDDSIVGANPRREIIRTQASPGCPIEIAALLYVNTSAEAIDYQVERMTGGWRVSEPSGDVTVSVRDGVLQVGEQPAHERAPAAGPAVLLPVPTAQSIPLPWRRLELDDEPSAVTQRGDRLAVGTRNGTVLCFDPAEREAWQTRGGSEILSLHFFGEGLLVGRDNGTLSLLDASGKTTWDKTIPYALKDASHWSDARSRIREISSADINGDGEAEILISNGDGRVYAFDRDGRELWRAPVNWGNYVAMTPGRYRGEFGLWGGSSHPSICGRPIIFGADGAERQPVLERCYDEGAGLGPEGQRVRDVRLADINGDGQDEAVYAVDTDCGHVFASDQRGKTIWEAHLAGPATAIAVAVGRERAQVICCSACGYVCALDGATGEQVWFCYIGGAAELLWRRADATIVAVLASGEVFLLSADGRLLGREELDSSVTALLRPGEDRGRAERLPIGTRDRVLRVLAG